MQAPKFLFGIASNIESQFTRVEQSLLNQLECPVCVEYMKPPIMLCGNGHNICNTCKRKVPHCPTCREQFLSTRNVALEALATEVKYPCTYRDYGCREMYKLDLIGGHQQKCQYIPQPCPVNKLNIGTCTWTGISSSMMSHLKQAHNPVIMDSHGHGTQINRDPSTLSFLHYHGTQINCGPFMPSNVSYGNCGPCKISGVSPTKKHCKLLIAYNVAFCSRSEIKNGIFYYVLQYIGPAAEAAKYPYKLQFCNKEGTEGLAVKLLARSWDEDLSEIHNSGSCVKLYPEQFNRFANEKSELAFSVHIITV